MIHYTLHTIENAIIGRAKKYVTDAGLEIPASVVLWDTNHELEQLF
ncbi:MAG: hypothetical protein V7K40_13265 [Nostoc sp.]